MRGTGWVFVLGKLDAGKRGRMETGQMGTWGGEGEEGERKGIRADADGSPMDAMPGDWREEKLDGLVSWESLLCVRGISRRVRHGWDVVRMSGLIEYESK